MKIGIDARCLEKKMGNGGVKRILSNLLREWMRDNPGHEFFLYFDEDEDLAIDGLNLKPPLFKCVVLKPPPFLRYGLFWENILLPFQLMRNKVQILLSPNYTTPLLYPGAKCVIVHDISYKTLVQQASFRTQFMMNAQSFLSCIFSSKIITVSEYSKGEVVRHYKIDPRKIDVIYCGVEGYFKPLDHPPAYPIIIKGVPLPKKYILFVGSIFNRRHPKELLAAYHRLMREETNDIDLIVIGKNMTVPKIDIDGEISRSNSKLGRNRIWHFNYVEEDDLLTLYQNCALFVYPSSYEGFGLPPLEAMACGKPVVTGDKTSLPEVVGDGAICIDPTDAGSIYQAFHNILNSPALQEKLIQQALTRVKAFSWGRTAKCYLDLFSSIINGQAQNQ